MLHRVDIARRIGRAGLVMTGTAPPSGRKALGLQCPMVELGRRCQTLALARLNVVAARPVVLSFEQAPETATECQPFNPDPLPLQPFARPRSQLIHISAIRHHAFEGTDTPLQACKAELSSMSSSITATALATALPLEQALLACRKTSPPRKPSPRYRVENETRESREQPTYIYI